MKAFLALCLVAAAAADSQFLQYSTLGSALYPGMTYTSGLHPAVAVQQPIGYKLDNTKYVLEKKVDNKYDDKDFKLVQYSTGFPAVGVQTPLVYKINKRDADADPAVLLNSAYTPYSSVVSPMVGGYSAGLVSGIQQPVVYSAGHSMVAPAIAGYSSVVPVASGYKPITQYYKAKSAGVTHEVISKREAEPQFATLGYSGFGLNTALNTGFGSAILPATHYSTGLGYSNLYNTGFASRCIGGVCY